MNANLTIRQIEEIKSRISVRLRGCLTPRQMERELTRLDAAIVELGGTPRPRCCVHGGRVHRTLAWLTGKLFS